MHEDSPYSGPWVAGTSDLAGIKGYMRADIWWIAANEFILRMVVAGEVMNPGENVFFDFKHGEPSGAGFKMRSHRFEGEIISQQGEPWQTLHEGQQRLEWIVRFRADSENSCASSSGDTDCTRPRTVLAWIRLASKMTSPNLYLHGNPFRAPLEWSFEV